MNLSIRQVYPIKTEAKSMPHHKFSKYNHINISSSKNSIGSSSTTSSTFYVTQRNQTLINYVLNRLKTKNKKSMHSILNTKSNDFTHLNLSTNAWCLYDSKTNTHFGFRQRYQREIASLTKIMTTLVSIQFLEKYQIQPELYVKVTETASKMLGTSADLKYKTWIKFVDLLYGTMLPSGNDAAFLLSEIIGYLSKIDLNNKRGYLHNLKFLDICNENTILCTVQFVKMMNQKAEQLGMIYTKFSNPHGLQNAMNVSTPKDLILLSFHASKNQMFKKIMNQSQHRYQFAQLVQDNTQNTIGKQLGRGGHRERKQCIRKTKKIWENTNLLLKKGWEGVKTGKTGAAGSCLASVKDGIYIVVLNCKDSEARFAQTQRIFRWYTSKNKNQSTTLDSAKLSN